MSPPPKSTTKRKKTVPQKRSLLDLVDDGTSHVFHSPPRFSHPPAPPPPPPPPLAAPSFFDLFPPAPTDREPDDVAEDDDIDDACSSVFFPSPSSHLHFDMALPEEVEEEAKTRALRWELRELETHRDEDAPQTAWVSGSDPDETNEDDEDDEDISPPFQPAPPSFILTSPTVRKQPAFQHRRSESPLLVPSSPDCISPFSRGWTLASPEASSKGPPQTPLRKIGRAVHAPSLLFSPPPQQHDTEPVRFRLSNAMASSSPMTLPTKPVSGQSIENVFGEDAFLPQVPKFNFLSSLSQSSATSNFSQQSSPTSILPLPEFFPSKPSLNAATLHSLPPPIFSIPSMQLRVLDLVHSHQLSMIHAVPPDSLSPSLRYLCVLPALQQEPTVDTVVTLCGILAKFQMQADQVGILATHIENSPGG